MPLGHSGGGGGREGSGADVTAGEEEETGSMRTTAALSKVCVCASPSSIVMPLVSSLAFPCLVSSEDELTPIQL